MRPLKPENYQPLVIWAAIVLHLLQGILVLSSATTDNAVASGTLLLFFGDHTNLGIGLISVSLLAIWAMARKHNHRLTALLWLLPQQAIMFVVALGALYFATQGHYADGTVRSTAFILVDQLPSIVLFGAHTIAMIKKVQRG